MTEIAVTPMERDHFGVQVTEGETITGHRVAVPAATLDAFAVSGADREQVVRETFAFLLEREPATSIEREFALGDVSRFFPELPAELQRRLGGSDGDGGLSDEEKESLEGAAADRNPDETTRREALELDLMEQGRSGEGEEIGDEMD